MAFQELTLTVTVDSEDADAICREFNTQLDILSEEYPLYASRVVLEDCLDPEETDRHNEYDYEDAA